MPSPAGPSSPAIPGEYRYQNFDVEIRKGPGEDYTVAARTADTGETTEVIPFPFDPVTLEHRQDKLQIALGRGRTRMICADDERPVRDFGTELFFAFFPATIRSLYEAGRTRARQESMGLRIRLHLHEPELATLPWEFLYDPRHGDYISLSRDIPVVRYIDAPVEIRPLRIDPPVRILCMVASPNDRISLDVEREKDQLKRAVRPLVEQGLAEIVFSEGQTWRDLMQKMQKGPFHIFHFIGHGGFSVDGDEGFIALRADDGRTHPLSAQLLARFLADHAPLRLVVLNSCEGARGSRRDIFSSTSSILVRRGIPAVVAMQYPISDEAAIEFSRSFYESLIGGLPVDTSMAEARKAMSAAFPAGVEWGTPVLYMRSQDGVLFTIDRSRPRTLPAIAVPEPVPVPVPVPVQEKPAAGTSTCTVCGNMILPGQRFCSRCMVSVSPAPAAIPVVHQPPPVISHPPPVQIPAEPPYIPAPPVVQKIPVVEIPKVLYPWAFTYLGIFIMVFIVVWGFLCAILLQYIQNFYSSINLILAPLAFAELFILGSGLFLIARIPAASKVLILLANITGILTVLMVFFTFTYGAESVRWLYSVTAFLTTLLPGLFVYLLFSHYMKAYHF